MEKRSELGRGRRGDRGRRPPWECRWEMVAGTEKERSVDRVWRGNISRTWGWTGRER